MSEENVELAYQAMDAVNRRDLDALLKLMDEDVESVSRIVAMEGGLHGHVGIRRWWKSWFDAFPDYQLEVVELRDHQDAVVATLRAVGHGAGSDLPVEDNIFLVSQWRDRRCVWWQVFRTKAEALEAAGLSEEAMSEENVELARRYFEAFNAEGLEATEHLRHPGVEMFDPPELPDSGRHVGEAAFRALTKEIIEMGWDGQYRDPEFLDADPEVAVVWRLRGHTSHGGGYPMELEVVHLWLFENGKLRRIRAFMDRKQAFEAAGLSE